MYVALLAVLLGLAAWLSVTALRDSRRPRFFAGVTLAALTLAFFGSLDFWGELLWFHALGYGERFWTAVGGRVRPAAVAGAVRRGPAAFLWRSPCRDRRLRGVASALGAAAGGLWGSAPGRRSCPFSTGSPPASPSRS